MRKLFKILGQIKNEFPNEVIIESGDFVNEGEPTNENIETTKSSTSQYLIIERNNLDITSGIKFDVIFPFSNPKNYIKIDTILKSVNVNPKIDSNIIPAGYSGIGLFEFPKGKPNILYNLNEYNKPRNNEKEYAIYFTTQSIMNRIIKLLNE